MSTETSLRERLENAKERHDRGYAQPWRPDPGDIIVGELVDYQENVKTQYGVSDVAELKTDHGQRRAVWLFHEVLADQWAEKDPSIGDRVGVLYYGKTDPENGGSSYHNYQVDVEPAEDSKPSDPDESLNGTPEQNGEDLPF